MDLYVCELALLLDSLCSNFFRGFDLTVVDDVLSVNKCGRHIIPKAIEHDAELLNKAFVKFCQADLVGIC